MGLTCGSRPGFRILTEVFPSVFKTSIRLSKTDLCCRSRVQAAIHHEATLNPRQTEGLGVPQYLRQFSGQCTGPSCHRRQFVINQLARNGLNVVIRLTINHRDRATLQ